MSIYTHHIIDVISLAPSSGYTLDEKGISWLSDREVKFQNVQGFKKAVGDIGDTCETALGSAKYAGIFNSSLSHSYLLLNLTLFLYLSLSLRFLNI
jgi:hypothetical protein